MFASFLHVVAIESGLPDKDVKVMCMKYAELEKSLGEIDRARAIYNFSSQYADPRKVTDNVEDIDLPEGSDGEDDDKIEIAHKDVPAAVFGDLVNKVEENNKDGDEETYSKLGALERIKRQRQ
ncbi:hypothetical protein IFM89_000035, partial [Coptis chinensis]